MVLGSNLKRHLLVLAAVLAVVPLSSCAGGDDESSRVAAQDGDEQTTQPDGALTSDPEPVTLRGVDQLADDSPQKTVMRLWFWAQWGSAPDIVEEYDPSVRETIDIATLVSAYAFQRQSLLASEPRLISTRVEGNTGFVAVEVLRRDQAPTRESFSLRRVDGQWRIVYDTLLDKLIPAYIHSRYQTDPNAAPSKRAREIADFQVRNFRTAFLNSSVP